MSKKIIYGIVGIIILAGVFYGGMVYGKSQTTTPNGNVASTSGFPGTRTRGAGAGFAGATIGQIVSKDSTSITLQLPNNSGSKIIFYSNATQISKMTSGTANDLTGGENISVTGTTNSDGSVTAQNIQIRPTK